MTTRATRSPTDSEPFRTSEPLPEFGAGMRGGTGRPAYVNNLREYRSCAAGIEEAGGSPVKASRRATVAKTNVPYKGGWANRREGAKRISRPSRRRPTLRQRAAGVGPTSGGLERSQDFL